MQRKQLLVWAGLLVVLVAINLKLAAGTTNLTAGATNLQDLSCFKDCGLEPRCIDDSCRSHRSCCLGPSLCHITFCARIKHDVDPASGIKCRESGDMFDDRCEVGEVLIPTHFCQ